MTEAEGWHICRAGFVETVRAVGLAAATHATTAVKDEWPAFGVDLRSLDALHLAATLVLPGENLVFATWDRRLHAAAGAEGLGRIPDTLG
jgi:hypothetical protein